MTRCHSERNQGAAALQREHDKRSKYEQLAKDNQLHFTPIALESYGFEGAEMVKFVKRLVRMAWERGGQVTPLSVLTEYWNKRISVQLQIANASMMLTRTSFLCQHKTELHNDDSYCPENVRDSVVYVGFSR